MLKFGVRLLVVGKVTMNDSDRIELSKPANDKRYIMTKMCRQELIETFEQRAQNLNTFSKAIGVVALVEILWWAGVFAREKLSEHTS